MKMSPPWSRRRWTQPFRVTRWPACSARSSPQVCVLCQDSLWTSLRPPHLNGRRFNRMGYPFIGAKFTKSQCRMHLLFARNGEISFKFVGDSRRGSEEGASGKRLVSFVRNRRSNRGRRFAPRQILSLRAGGRCGPSADTQVGRPADGIGPGGAAAGSSVVVDVVG